MERERGLQSAFTPVRGDTLSSSSVDEVQYPGLEESMLLSQSSFFYLVSHSHLRDLLLGASDPVEDRTISDAPRSWTWAPQI